jgi:uncharacterized protein YbjT (DUF2867 family)
LRAAKGSCRSFRSFLPAMASILVSGVSGYIGGALVPRLKRDGHQLRGMSRNPDSKTARAAGIPLVQADAVTGQGLDRALEGVEVAYYLMHSMEPVRRGGEGMKPGGGGTEPGGGGTEPGGGGKEPGGGGTEPGGGGTEPGGGGTEPGGGGTEPGGGGTEPGGGGTEPGGGEGMERRFEERERVSAENFASAARRAGVRRVIYLGGPMPSGGRLSRHLGSRLAVEEILLAASPESVAFRASIVIGARSRSFRFLVRLVERMPALAIPGWGVHRSAPIDERDAIELLARAATSDAVAGRSLDLRGPEVVTYSELIERIVDALLVARPAITLPRGVSLTPIASRVAAAIAGEQLELVEPLMESLEDDLLPRDDAAAQLLGVRLHSLDAAIEHALREWETQEPLRAR